MTNNTITDLIQDDKSDEQVKTINDFIQNELKEFAVYDNSRSIPSVVDGLKTSQRKVIYATFTLKKDTPIKTSALGAKSSDLTHYKHGEASIIGTVIKLAQDYAGSNNYPLLLKDGQFGTAQNNISSSPRYIHVSRSDNLDTMFDENDREIVNYLKFDGDDIEPEYYLPKLPVIAINGTAGIGNGYSTKILQRSVKNVKEYVEQLINKTEPDKKLLIPAFNGFNGTVEVITDSSFLLKGRFERINSTTLVIKDLPPTSSFQYENYKERVLIPLKIDTKSGIGEFENESKDGSWEIIIKHDRAFGKQTDDEILKALKMTEKVSENITVWGFDNKFKIFENIYQLVEYWVTERAKWHQVRKDHVLSKMAIKNAYQEDLLKLIEFWLENKDITSMKKDDLINKLKTVVENEEHISKFLDQNIMSLTKERVDKLRKDISVLLKDKKTLEKKTVQSLFLEDINIF